MQENQRMIRPALAVIVLICFLMPFIKISCAGQPIASVSGVDLAFGKKIDTPNPFGASAEGNPFAENYQTQQPGNGSQSEDQLQFYNSEDSSQQLATTGDDNPFASAGSGDAKIESQPIAAIALGLAVFALIGALGSTRRSMQISAACAGLTAILLVVLKTNFNAEIPEEMAEMLGFEWTWSFWTAMLASAVLAVFSVKLMSETSNTKPTRLVIQTYTDMPPSVPSQR